MEQRQAIELKKGKTFKLSEINLKILDFLDNTCAAKKVLRDTFVGLYAKNIPKSTALQVDSGDSLYLNTPAALQKRNEIFAAMIIAVDKEVIEAKKIFNFYVGQLLEYIELIQNQIDKAIEEKKFNNVVDMQVELERAKIFLEQMILMKEEISKLIKEITVEESKLFAGRNDSIVSITDIFKDKIPEFLKNFSIPHDGTAETEFLNHIIKDSKKEFDNIPTLVDIYLRTNKNLTLDDLNKFVSGSFEKIIRDKIEDHPEAKIFPNISKNIDKAAELFSNKFWVNDIKRQELATNHLRLNQYRDQKLDLLGETKKELINDQTFLDKKIAKNKALPLPAASKIPQAESQIPTDFSDKLKAITNIVNNTIGETKAVTPRLNSLASKLRAAREKSLSIPSTPAPAYEDKKPENQAEVKASQNLSEKPKDKEEKSIDYKKPDTEEENHRSMGPGRR